MRLSGDIEASRSSRDFDLEGTKQVSSHQDQDKDECFLFSLPNIYAEVVLILWF